MVKLRDRIIAIVLLVVWCTMVCAGDSNPQYRDVVINTSDSGKIIFFIIYVILSEIGKKLDKGYVCPVYCSIDHIHRWRCNNEAQDYPQGDYDIFRPDGDTDPKQSKSDLRSARSVWIECSDSDSLVGIL